MNYNVNIAQTTALVSGDPRDNLAPAINNGDAFGTQMEDAALEADTRKRLRQRDPNTVTAAEVKASRRRLVAVENYEAQVTHGMGNAAVLTAIADLGAQLNARFTELNARMTNARSRERNRNMEWIPLVVERGGANAIGVVPAAFPASRESLNNLSGVQITNLQNAYNLPAVAFAGENLASRRIAALRYFCEG
uniref:Uncharacterized protein n=1 Tax=Grammatophora oceanica TaxID=210454 RepID=A0A7S1Y694_9STRA|mmetsp:Transcript_32744/g.48517  ORF Transcript_32744/g.48517 Transcript_32744/m.48517 type:complete len:193 (+) Transcript_32744:50-628(+)|eukprot:CAMPEP_0194071826 /NCGR_PEP_ID=MMETSP0009_2-20130614/88912_1 /TAXON_ID=210454 /ORGANISM="Grammatophora oceanica, Strain CCMP 410" /LENGTH=192 /DNA_ID=CAMNT_0038725171 /DNA_START=51 /DNA_END=629 /DNA_ORIENTATION=-